MNNRQKIVQQQFLNNEKEVLNRLKQNYGEALNRVNKKVEKLQLDIDGLNDVWADFDGTAEEKEVLLSRIQSKIYQKQYQEAIQGQIDGVLKNLQENAYKSISEYLDKSYEDGFIGTMYDLQGQGIPLIMPIDQQAMVRAVQLDSKISKGLYSGVGEDVAELKKRITMEVSRGLANGLSYSQVARCIKGHMVGAYTKKTGGALYRAEVIARTEGHRIQVQATMDACYEAKDKGADVVKQWDSTMDSSTRESHVKVDGEIKELDEVFSNGLMFPGDPSGRPEEVINCRCALLQRARWALGDGFTKYDNFSREHKKFEDVETYNEFKKAYFSKENKAYMKYVGELEDQYKTKDFKKLISSLNDNDYKQFVKLQDARPMFSKMYKAEHEEQFGVLYGESAINVDFDYINSKEYRQKFEKITDNARVNDSIYEITTDILKHRDGTEFEDLYLINTVDGSIISQVVNTSRKSGVVYTDEFIEKLKKCKENGIPIIGIHNHPQGTPPSPDDFRKAYDNKYTFGIVVGHNGQVYKYDVPDEAISVEFAEAMSRDIGIFALGGTDIDRACNMVYNGCGLNYTIIE